ncbi:hypothetical protein D8I35_12815 [Corticibacter populi]|uniref:Uncharacterized protein n=1 Tax=Corticibacter populi TaxID=1550736 RepID=A0A3M6QPP0_9BURK|nr:hypothetical protein [Corticibacter populi]RMX04751.1 hypothetical protein D8I35_12815 [Corticibacter populi]
MSIVKTAKGVQALEGKQGMPPRMRQLLILCNGKRSATELGQIFGADTPAQLQQLEAAGLISGVSKPVPAGGGNAPPPRAKNRSLAACKVYVLDLLQLQQSEGAGHVATTLRGSSNPQQMLELMLVTLDLILTRSGERYVERVAQRLFEIVPDEHLDILIHMAIDMQIPVLRAVAMPYQALLQPA